MFEFIPFTINKYDEQKLNNVFESYKMTIFKTQAKITAYYPDPLDPCLSITYLRKKKQLTLKCVLSQLYYKFVEYRRYKNDVLRHHRFEKLAKALSAIFSIGPQEFLVLDPFSFCMDLDTLDLYEVFIRKEVPKNAQPLEIDREYSGPMCDHQIFHYNSFDYTVINKGGIDGVTDRPIVRLDCLYREIKDLQSILNTQTITLADLLNKENWGNLFKVIRNNKYQRPFNLMNNILKKGYRDLPVIDISKLTHATLLYYEYKDALWENISKLIDESFKRLMGDYKHWFTDERKNKKIKLII